MDSNSARSFFMVPTFNSTRSSGFPHPRRPSRPSSTPLHGRRILHDKSSQPFFVGTGSVSLLTSDGCTPTSDQCFTVSSTILLALFRLRSTGGPLGFCLSCRPMVTSTTQPVWVDGSLPSIHFPRVSGRVGVVRWYVDSGRAPLREEV